MTRIMAIDGRHVTIYESFTEAARKTGISEVSIKKLIDNGKMKEGYCFDITLDSKDKE